MRHRVPPTLVGRGWRERVLAVAAAVHAGLVPAWVATTASVAFVSAAVADAGCDDTPAGMAAACAAPPPPAVTVLRTAALGLALALVGYLLGRGLARLGARFQTSSPSA
jgi:hypothetical protein